MDLAIYLAKLSAYWIALYVLYALFLRRQTFLRWNRAYLLGSLVLSFVLPLVQYPEAAPPLPVVYQVSAASFTVVSAATSPSLLTWENLLWLVYGVGVLVMLVRLAGSFRHLYSFLQKGDGVPMEGYTLVLLDTNAAGSFSFLKWVFISPADYLQNFDTILTHEMVHVRQRHSWDIVLVEILHVVFWFNPVLVLYKKALQEVHEYLADQQVALAQSVTNHPDRYAEFLISYTLGTPTNVLTNQFFNSKLLKSRITMLYKTKNSKWSLGKYAAVALIVGCASLMVASCEREVMPTTNDSVGKNVSGKINVSGVVKGSDGKPIPGASIETVDGNTGTSTDKDGKFRLPVPAGTDLVVKFTGFKEHLLEVNPKFKEVAFMVAMTPGEGRTTQTTSMTSADGQTLKSVSQTSTYNNEPIFTVVEKSPEFPGGIEAMYKFLGENIKYPEPAAKANVQGRVFLNFVITTEGEVKDIQILKGIGFGADEESIRVVSKMPRWNPGMQSGRAVNVRYNLPIAFRLDGDKEIKANESEKKVGLAEQLTPPGRPIFIIDGIDKGTEFSVAKMDKESIQMIYVLKGQKATDKYGTKGANGVVEITTKK